MKSYNYRLMRLRLINKWQYHDKETGFLEWKPNTPQCAIDALNELCLE